MDGTLDERISSGHGGKRSRPEGGAVAPRGGGAQRKTDDGPKICGRVQRPEGESDGREQEDAPNVSEGPERDAHSGKHVIGEDSRTCGHQSSRLEGRFRPVLLGRV